MWSSTVLVVMTMLSSRLTIFGCARAISRWKVAEAMAIFCRSPFLTGIGQNAYTRSILV